jgi:hypothetical protein
VAGSYGDCNELLGSIKELNFLITCVTIQLLKMDSAPWIYFVFLCRAKKGKDKN